MFTIRSKFAAMLLVSAFTATALNAQTLRMAHESPETHAKGIWANSFAEALKEKTSGALTVDVFPHGQLYESEQAAIDAVIGGVIDIAIPSTGYMSSVVPEFEVIDLPMLFKDQESLYGFEDGKVGQELLGLVEPRGLIGLEYISNVSLDLFTKTPVSTLEEMKGKRIRAHSAVLEETVSALGGNPISMRASELYLALEQGIVDGAFTTVAFAAPNRYEEVTPYLTRVAVSSIAYPVVMNLNRFNGLSEEYQIAIREAAAEATRINRLSVAEQTESHVKALTDGGVEIVTLTDEERGHWRDALNVVYEVVAKRVGSDLVQRVQNLN